MPEKAPKSLIKLAKPDHERTGFKHNEKNIEFKRTLVAEARAEEARREKEH